MMRSEASHADGKEADVNTINTESDTSAVSVLVWEFVVFT